MTFLTYLMIITQKQEPLITRVLTVFGPIPI